MKQQRNEDDDEDEEIEEIGDEEPEEEEEIKPIKPLKKIEDKSKSKVSSSDKYSLVEVPTQTQVMFKDSNEKIFDVNFAICKIMNDIELIKRNLI